MTIICIVWTKFAAGIEASIPKVSSEEGVSDFLRLKGSRHKEFLPEGQTLKSEFYTEVMNRFLKRIRRVRPGKFQSSNWFLLHDNASFHNATIVNQFLAKKSVTVLYHPLTRHIWHLRTAFYFLK
jgi:hypothetical protein